MNQSNLIFYHSPQTRSTGVRILLEELDAPFELKILNMKKGEQREPAYLAVNPMGKVPAIVHNGTLVTEQVAIFIYLADIFLKKNLAPALVDPSRGAYLRWLVFYAACFEPAITDKALKRDPAQAMTSTYGDYATMLKTLTDQLAQGPYLLGEQFSAADILWGTALTWTSMWQLVPSTPVIEQYVKRHQQRPCVVRVTSHDAELAARHQQEAAVMK